MLKRMFMAVLALSVMAAWGCGKASHSAKIDGAASVPIGARIKVVDVSNDSQALPDVDMIGLLWDSLKEQLHKDGMLWTKDAVGTPLLLEAHIVKYQKGDDIKRWLMPVVGKTLLAVRCDVKDGDRLVASVEVQRSIAFGDGIYYRAWKQIFVQVAEDAVRELRSRLRGS
jgi:hypothetical protein